MSHEICRQVLASDVNAYAKAYAEAGLLLEGHALDVQMEYVEANLTAPQRIAVGMGGGYCSICGARDIPLKEVVKGEFLCEACAETTPVQKCAGCGRETVEGDFLLTAYLVVTDADGNEIKREKMPFEDYEAAGRPNKGVPAWDDEIPFEYNKGHSVAWNIAWETFLCESCL